MGTTYTGKNAAVYLSGLADSSYALSDFSLTLNKGTVEQELVGESGNYSVAGARSCEGSFTGCKLTSAGLGVIVGSLINGASITISGNAGTTALHFNIVSAQVTNFDFSLGDADTITEGSFDWVALYPYKISTVTKLAGGGTGISDWGTY